MIEPSRGAYGFRLEYGDWGGALQDLVELDPAAELVRLAWRHACPIVDFDSSGKGHASYGTRGATAFYVQSYPSSILFDIGVEPAPDALVHPIATVPLAVLARWRGDVTLHAGAFAAGGYAWALIGRREAGKSTALGVLAQSGYPIVADDLLAVHNGVVHSGPHCVDLRPDAAERLGPTRDLGVFGPRRRFRLSSPPAPSSLPLGGFFLLDWHDAPSVAVTRVALRDRVKLLYELEYVALVGPADPRAVLDLAAMPSWRVTRPRDWDATEDAVGRIVEIAQAVGRPTHAL
jgi:hypothetical protein